ncbi:hypothetical protein CJ030_MR7G013550 [Morella rubra]|uniref:Uncharacterized protein n=1 Tax=Morella rubra TaxID=262757 RepID=A0A6A1V219_9ROSI|nr:hypothetical protein CJ030_MR7G013550 [Morella rubra]
MVRVKLPAQRVASRPPRMTRKRKVASASTSKPSKSQASQEDREPEILEDFNDALFYNPEAETLFHTKFSLKKIELEKEVLIEELSHLPMIGQLTSRGWGPLLHHLSPPPASVTIGKDTIKQSESHKRQNPQRCPSDVPDLTDAIKLLLDRSSAIKSAPLQSDMAVTRLELSQVRADIKLLQPLLMLTSMVMAWMELQKMLKALRSLPILKVSILTLCS